MSEIGKKWPREPEEWEFKAPTSCWINIYNLRTAPGTVYVIPYKTEEQAKAQSSVRNHDLHYLATKLVEW